MSLQQARDVLRSRSNGFLASMRLAVLRWGGECFPQRCVVNLTSSQQFTPTTMLQCLQISPFHIPSLRGSLLQRGHCLHKGSGPRPLQTAGPQWRWQSHLRGV